MACSRVGTWASTRAVIEANASLRSLSERNTEEAYWDYVRRLAKEAGLETTDGAALRNFDRHRAGKKLSNEQWQNPYDPDAKIGRTKDGATDMIYLPEHTVDLDTGAIVQAQVLAGDHRDSEELSERVIEAVLNVQEALADPEVLPETLTADKGYFSLLEMGCLQELSLKTVISDPRRTQRRLDKLERAQRQTLARAQRSVSSQDGRKLLAQTRPAHRTQLCPCARRRRDAPGHLAGTGEPQQATSDRRRLL